MICIFYWSLNLHGLCYFNFGSFYCMYPTLAKICWLVPVTAELCISNQQEGLLILLLCQTSSSNLMWVIFLLHSIKHCATLPKPQSHGRQKGFQEMKVNLLAYFWKNKWKARQSWRKIIYIQCLLKGSSIYIPCC